MNRILSFLLLLFIFFPSRLDSQSLSDSISIEIGSIISGGSHVPFWLISNRFGTVDNSVFNGWFRASVYRDFKKEKSFDYYFGLDLLNLYGETYRPVLNQTYFGIRFRYLQLEAGKREEIFGNQDSLLSSGGILWSGNAPPMPEITLRTAGYIPVPFTLDNLYFKAGMSHGWFNEDAFSQHIWMHHKYLFFKSSDKLPVVLSAGLHHFVQWGGTSKDTAVGPLPKDIKAFWDIFTAGAGSKDSPVNEKLNALGNHLGSYNVRLDLHLRKFKAGLYWQSIFEDNSGRKLRNGEDGLWGLSIRYQHASFLPSGVVFEYLNTTNQSGRAVIDPNHPSAPTGNDNYFNNGIYRAGWSYDERSIGTPLISSPFYFSEDQGNYFRNNRVRAFHLGLYGISSSGSFSYRLFYTYSRNFGTYDAPFQSMYGYHSSLFEFKLKDIFHSKNDISISAAIDYGLLYGNSTGFQVKLFRKLN